MSIAVVSIVNLMNKTNHPIVQILVVGFLFIFGITIQSQTFPSPTTFSVDWSPDGTLLAVADTDGLRLLDAENSDVIRTFPVQSTPVYVIAWSPDGKLLASGGANGALEIWDISSGQHLANLQGHTNTVNALAWNKDGTQLASVSLIYDGSSLKIWDMKTFQNLGERTVGFAERVVWSHDNQQLFISTLNAGAFAYDSQLMIGSALTYDIAPDIFMKATSLALHPDNDMLAIGIWDGTVYLWDAITNQAVMILTGHSDVVSDVEWSLDGSFLVSTSVDGSIKFWDTESGFLIDEIVQSERLYTISLSPDSTQIAYGGENMSGNIITLPRSLIVREASVKRCCL